MNKEFIPYEQALELKELGFDEPCFGCYDEIKKILGIVQHHYTNKHLDGLERSMGYIIMSIKM